MTVVSITIDLPDDHPWIVDPRPSLLVIDHAGTPNGRLIKIVRQDGNKLGGLAYKGAPPQ